MSKSSETSKQYKLYILASTVNHDTGRDFNNVKDCIQHIKERFESEYQWMIDRYGTVKALSEWLQGLALDIEFYYHDIIERAKLYGSLPESPTDKECEKITSNYWNYMANKLNKMIYSGYQVPTQTEYDNFLKGGEL